MMKRIKALACAVGMAGFLGAVSARGQFLASDQVPQERTIPEKQLIDDDLDRAKLHLGPIRILPAVSIQNAGYDSNVFSSASNPFADWTATIAAGAELLVPMGQKMYLRANIFPHYTWYDKLSDRNRFGGQFDLSILGFFNRLTFQATGSDRQDYVLYSSELPSYVFEDLRSATGGVEVALTNKVSLFANGGYQQVRYTQYSGPPLQDVQVKLNNSDDSEVRGGVRYSIAREWSVAAVAEETWSNFQFETELRDNKSTAYLGGIYYNHPRFFVNVLGGWREGSPNNGSLYPQYQTPVGSFFLSFFPLYWIELRGYGIRKVQYSISAFNPYYFDNKVGAGANIELFEHVLVRGYVEDGPNEYPGFQIESGELVKRIDHVKTYGGGLSIKLPARVVLTGLVTRQIYNSNIPSESRNFTRFTCFLNFTGVYAR